MQSNTPILHRVVLRAGWRVSKLAQIDWSALCNSHHVPPVVAERERARLKFIQPESPPPSAGNGLALVDAVIVQQLTRDVGIQRLPAVLGAFVAELGRRIPLVRAAIDARDLPLLGRESHSLKGSAMTFGAPALAAVGCSAWGYCSRLEAWVVPVVTRNWRMRRHDSRVAPWRSRPEGPLGAQTIVFSA